MAIENEKVVQLSFGWVIAALVVVVLTGLVGGILAQTIWGPRAIPVTTTENGVVATVQEVTIAPSQARSELVAKHVGSVLRLSPLEEPATETVVVGPVITNDGVVVTPAISSFTEATAYDSAGRALKVDYIGNDELFGLSFWRVANSVVTPLDFQNELAAVGSSAVAVATSITEPASAAENFDIKSWQLSRQEAAGRSVFLKGNGLQMPVGSPLLSDNGKMVGMLLDPGEGLALNALDLVRSFERLSRNERERDVFAELGITGARTFEPNENNEQEFGFEILRVTSRTPAQDAGLKRGDKVVGVGEEKLTPQSDIVKLLQDLQGDLSQLEVK